MSQVKQEGVYKARITDFGLIEADSGAVGVSIRTALYERWTPDQEWEVCDLEAEGTLWIVKKDGSANTPAVESLVNHAGWNGNVLSIFEHTWQPRACQVTVKADTYKNETRYKIAFVNSLNRAPGGMGNITKERAQAIQSKMAKKAGRILQKILMMTYRFNLIGRVRMGAALF